MRDTFESIDEATAADDVLREALYELAAHEIATQALDSRCGAEAMDRFG